MHMLTGGGSNSNSRTLFLYDEVGEHSIQPIIEGIIELNAVSIVQPITLVISTFGGELYDMFALYDAMSASVAPIHTVGLGKIMSAGCLLLAAGKKGMRSMGRNARLMYHPAHGGGYGDIFQQQNELTEFKKEQRALDSAVAVECGRTLAEVEALYKTHQRMDVYMSSSQALDFGFADQLVGAKPIPPAPKVPAAAAAAAVAAVAAAGPVSAGASAAGGPATPTTPATGKAVAPEKK